MKKDSYEQKAMTSMVWKFLERIASQLVSVSVSIILARILCPEDYSVVSLVTIFFSIADVIVSGGFNSALVQKKDADEKDYSSVFCVSVLVSFLMYGILFFSAPLIADLYDQKSLILLTRAMGLVLPMNAIRSVWSAKVSSNLDFKKFFFCDFTI